MLSLLREAKQSIQVHALIMRNGVTANKMAEDGIKAAMTSIKRMAVERLWSLACSRAGLMMMFACSVLRFLVPPHCVSGKYEDMDG